MQAEPDRTRRVRPRPGRERTYDRLARAAARAVAADLVTACGEARCSFRPRRARLAQRWSTAGCPMRRWTSATRRRWRRCARPSASSPARGRARRAGARQTGAAHAAAGTSTGHRRPPAAAGRSAGDHRQGAAAFRASGGPRRQLGRGARADAGSRRPERIALGRAARPAELARVARGATPGRLLAHLQPLAELIRSLGAPPPPERPPAPLAPAGGDTALPLPRRWRRAARCARRADGHPPPDRRSTHARQRGDARSAIRCCTSCGARAWPKPAAHLPESEAAAGRARARPAGPRAARSAAAGSGSSAGR